MFDLHLQWDRPAKFGAYDSEHVLRVRLNPQSTSSQRLPLQIAVAIDNSSSMAEGNKLSAAKEAVQILLQQIRAEDTISIASFSSKVTPITRDRISRLQTDSLTRMDLALDWFAQTLSPKSGTASIAILITDGYPTNNRGRVLQDFNPLITQATQLAARDITLCTVGLGDAANFNSGFLVNLSEQGRGAFLYADTAATLTPLLQERLTICHAIIAETAQLKFTLANGVSINGFCQLRPEYLPLEEVRSNSIQLQGLRGDSPTDVLVAVSVPGSGGFEAVTGEQPILKVELILPGLAPILQAISLNYSDSYRVVQQVNEEVKCDRHLWDIQQYSTEMLHTHDAHRTGELLQKIQVAATKSNQSDILQQSVQQLEELQRSGQLDAHSRTSLYQTTKKGVGNNVTVDP